MPVSGAVLRVRFSSLFSARRIARDFCIPRDPGVYDYEPHVTSRAVYDD